MLPLALFSLGASGPWIVRMVRLAPYQPNFVAATIACLGCGYWLVYRALRKCTAGEGRTTLPTYRGRNYRQRMLGLHQDLAWAWVHREPQTGLLPKWQTAHHL